MATQPGPKHGSDFVTALLSRTQIKALDRYISEKAPGKTRSDVLRDAFEEWCIDRGYINPNEMGRDLS